MERFVAMKKRLEKAVKVEDEAEALSIMQSLAHEKINVSILEATRVGLAVGRIRKHKNSELAQEANRLVKHWKKLVAAEKADKAKAGSPTPPQTALRTPPAQTRENSSEEPLKGSSKTEQKTSPPSKHSTVAQNKKESANETGPTAVRDKIVTMLTEALNEQTSLAIISFKLTPAEAAHRIETAMLEKYKSPTDKEYKQKFRCLFSNLKNPKNEQLRLRVLTGELDPKTLIIMAPKELASEEHKERMKALEEACLKEAVRGEAQQATTEMFRCSKCKQRKCTYYQMQTRGADEPMTTFITCVNCTNRWKI